MCLHEGEERLAQTTCVILSIPTARESDFTAREGAQCTPKSDARWGKFQYHYKRVRSYNKSSDPTSGSGVIETQPSSDRGDADIWTWRIFSRLEQEEVTRRQIRAAGWPFVRTTSSDISKYHLPSRVGCARRPSKLYLTTSLKWNMEKSPNTDEGQ
ncbi:uncharacterized protein LOC123505020 [Portunus trituberculatus]|uniref:uncharacterized protein LOC123505020 n=1 Tax=Portunus trituberculatus TaxID=210409 RepID=UPI001E1CD404|nr:uncharacterized protein LOC123505020 [Portunus trituberculatus]